MFSHCHFASNNTLQTGLSTEEKLCIPYTGREAQKCYCLADSCSGFIGVSNEISVDVSSKTVNKRKKAGLEEKKKESSEDLILEEEIEKLHQNGGLRSKEDTLILARLMVRAEDTHSRQKLLEIILGTSDTGYLRLFLEYHGLSLLWSWMVDLTDTKLKNKVLQVLSFLPVSNKEMLLESKVYYVVERWSSNVLTPENQDDVQMSNDKNLLKEVKKVKSSDTSDSENDSSASQYLEESSVNNSIVSDVEDTSITNGKGDTSTSFRSDEEGSGCVKSKSKQEDLMKKAQTLLETWNDLKEDFKIPRQKQEKQHIQVYSRYNRNRRHDVCKLCYNRGLSSCKHNHDTRFSKDKKKDNYHSRNFKSLYRGEGKLRKALLPTPVVLSKEERRLQFAKEVEENDQRKALLQQQQLIDQQNMNCPTDHLFYNANPNYYYNPNDGNYYNASSGGYQLPVPETNTQPFNQCFYNSNELQPSHTSLLERPETLNNMNTGAIPPEINGSTVYPSNVLYQSSHQQIPVIGAQPSPYPIQPANLLAPCQTNHVPTPSNLIVLSSSPAVSAIPAVNPDVNSANVVMQSSVYNAVPSQTSMPVSPNSHYVQCQEQYSSDQNGVYYSQPQCAIPEPMSAVPNYCYNNSNGEIVENAVAVKLPPDWKTATDSDGNIYYYHILTRQTQWEAPVVEEVVEEADADADGDTPTIDEPKDHKQYEIHCHKSKRKHSKRKSTTTAPADTSSIPVNNEIVKKIKELFRTKMSSFVVQCLNPYHRDDCRVGKITTNDDFKHLARRLTHFVMAKELKHCKNVEDLECNENVKHKARDYIHKYMSKFGPVYKKDKYDSPIVC
ncbi:hypothetical protein JTE90_000042 [Oedothorax gibbosus]|uniref:Histone-lysine N-methyltransferase SETD2 n=1 Tax=Oedothorax gibbosus TaxID=931172 RepID=A0AAV6UE56_9ARAC|nr:hypothetical protein JTE90_000042 [Oedothorax gibbosus]